MRVPTLALALAVVVLAGCGRRKKTAKPNGEAAKPATRVLADAQAAATSAGSAHVSGSIVAGGTPITLDLFLGRGKAKGSMSTSGLEFQLVRVGDIAYIQGSDAFYKHYAPPVFLPLIRGKWLKASTSQGRFASLGPLTSIGALFAKVSSSHGKLVNDGKTTYRGQQVVAIRDRSDNSKLYVAATGKPYPVAIVGGKKNESGAISFSDWGTPVSVTAPKNAIDISRLGAG
jgi:hypothetical protein